MNPVLDCRELGARSALMLLFTAFRRSAVNCRERLNDLIYHCFFSGCSLGMIHPEILISMIRNILASTGTGTCQEVGPFRAGTRTAPCRDHSRTELGTLNSGDVLATRW